MNSYSSGTWLGVVTENGVAVLPGDTTPAMLANVYESLLEGAGLGALLDALTGSFGTSFALIPSFAIVTLGADEARIAVRGALSVAVQGDADHGRMLVSGARVTTWSESVSVNPASIEIVTDAAGDVSALLPIATGVVWCDSVRITLRPEDSAPDAVPEMDLVAQIEAAPEPGAAPEPEAAQEPVAVREPAAAPSGPVSARAHANASVSARTPAPVPSPVVVTSETLAVPEHTMGRDYDGLWDGSGLTPGGETPAYRPAAARSTLIDGLPAFVPPSVAGDAEAAVEIDLDHDSDFDHDHDGETLSVEQVRGLMRSSPTPPLWAAAVASAPPGSLLISSGGQVRLDRGAIIGRKPSAGRFAADRMPHLITVPSPQQDISRSHVEIRCEGSTVLALDLGTTNGTRLLRAGKEPERLHPQEPTMLVFGDVLDLGDEITVTFLELV
ncbi:hypothetical protein GY21_04300 [Cryobacterium roopkundense]|uniref:FHA domain-containing protein n=1 Tax=Cryobacterium roopkundense TaxID=1001240 RepID=A0A099JNE7_9MICO|nr:FHA domain-containing protein [Cryobacterium roopkundense]KGJ79655.1 hypothetical protein GY21_04300 [Cryobacterium roopkundense]MBB5642495.1 hypothetical protein [Cryobacterium roopkundense]